jgi:alkylhydroperoxidase/carboxymuconolactone decarboxylase family protein YurZ
MVTLEDVLARIALRDEPFIQTLSRVSGGGVELDQRTCELVKLAALIGIDGSLPSYVATVQAAQAAGASETEIVDTLVAVLPSAGSVRTSSAAPKIALALGLERNDALEEAELEAQQTRR